MKPVALLTHLCALTMLTACTASTQSLKLSESPTRALQETRRLTGAPGIAALVHHRGTTVFFEVDGHRINKSAARITPADSFHLGSNTKAMTGVLIALLVEEGVLSWDETLKDLFPDLEVHPALHNVTVLDLIRHEGGMPGYLARTHRSLWNQIWDALDDDVTQTRRQLAQTLVTMEPLSEPGTYTYSNSGYVLVASAIETRLKQSWEELIQARVFAPLGMKSCGFGAPQGGDIALPSQPWGHRKRADGSLKPMKPGPIADNPPVLAPAGGVHCSMQDWLRFTQLFTATSPTLELLSPSQKDRLLSPSDGGRYGGGWRRFYREWGEGLVLYHAGTNKRFYSIAWVAPETESVILIATNLYYVGIDADIDRLVGVLIRNFLKDRFVERAEPPVEPPA